jgi:hypothetical protein
MYFYEISNYEELVEMNFKPVANKDKKEIEKAFKKGQQLQIDECGQVYVNGVYVANVIQ